jgi:hypothetical protein
MPLIFESIGSADSAANSSDTTVDLGLPSGTVSGNLLIACFCRSATSRNFTASGWTAFANNTTNTALCVLYRIADGTESSTITFTSALTFNQGTGVILRFSGQADPFVYSEAGQVNRATWDTTLDYPSISVASNGDLVVWVGTTVSENSSSHSRGSAVERYDGRVGTHANTLIVHTEESVNAGATGTATAVVAAINNKFGMSFTVAAASGGGADPRRFIIS